MSVPHKICNCSSTRICNKSAICCCCCSFMLWSPLIEFLHDFYVGATGVWLLLVRHGKIMFLIVQRFSCHFPFQYFFINSESIYLLICYLPLWCYRRCNIYDHNSFGFNLPLWYSNFYFPTLSFPWLHWVLWWRVLIWFLLVLILEFALLFLMVLFGF